MAAYISFQPSDNFNTLLYTGTGSSNAITGAGFQPDMVWVKSRSAVYNHVLSDAVRGEKQLYPNTSGAQDSNSDEITSFDADGFTVGTGGDVNYSTATFVSYNWKMGTTTGVTFGSADITPSDYSINTTTGMAILKYSGNGSSAATVAHGLGAAPDCVIIKRIEDAGHGWQFTNNSLGFTKSVWFQTTSAEGTSINYWNNTAPTSDVVSIGGDSWNNLTGKTFMMYCFTNKKGFFKSKTYTGNGNVDGTFVYTGFRPAFVMTKKTNSTGNWIMGDSTRNPGNVIGKQIEANVTSAEYDSTRLDLLSNGFKCRASGSDANGSGSTYVYVAFAEFPFVSSNSKPGTAR